MNQHLKYSLVALLALVLAACGPSATPTTQTGAADSPVVPVIAVSELTVGPNRIALGLIRDNSPINDPSAKVHLRFYDRADTSSSVKAEADATYYGEGLPAAVYVAYPTFDRAGEWDIVIQTQLSGQAAPTNSKLRFTVQETSAVPNVGQQAISVKTPTVADTPPAQLSSDGKPNPALYQLSVDAALTSGKPTALLFATPAFCRTATCGPSVRVLGDLQKQFGDKMNFIHVEVYKFPFDKSFQAQQAGFSAGMAAWKLQTEPWLFLIDKNGTIQSRFEGGITKEELTPILQKLLGTS